MHVINFYKFRILQFFRILNKDITMLNSLVISFVIIFFVKLPNQNFYLILFLLLFLVIHSNRNDINFLKKIFNKTWYLIIYIEYLFLFSLSLILNKNYSIDYFFFISLIFLFGLIFIPKYKSNFILKLNKIPYYLFEIKSYIRKHFIFCIVTYILFLFSTFHPFSFILMLIISLEYISNIYSEYESKELMQSYFEKFDINFKIKTANVFFNIIFIPIYLLYVLQNYDKLEFLMLFFLILNLFIIERIIIKYKKYDNTKKNDYLFIADIFIITLKSVLILPVLLNLNRNKLICQKNINKYVRNK